MGDDLYKRDLFINENFPYLFNREIIEYDMREAGFSLTKEYELLPKSTIKTLERMKKDFRKVELGKIQRDNKEYREELKLSFKHARKLFIMANHLEKNDIVSIKKDAIFTLKRCKQTKVGDYIEFRIKNRYSSYMQLERNIEFYYNGDLDIKGMNSKNYSLHERYVIDFIKKFMKKMETSSEENVLDFTAKFLTDYKMRRLDVGYYRTFDHNSYYKLMNSDLIFDEFNQEDIDELDISTNYKILTKMIQIPL